MRFTFLTPLLLLLLVLSAGTARAAEPPVIRLGYVFTTNHTPLMVALALGDALTVDGWSLHPLLPKEKYELRKDGVAVAMLDILVNKSGSEAATLFAQGHLDIGLASITAIMTGIDKGSPMKIVSPLVLASGGLAVLKDSPIKDWAGLVTAAKEAKQPIKVGFHSPGSAPTIILESALKSEGLRVSRNPNDMEAQIVLVDLKGMPNLLPALSAGQVDAVVGPEPFPQTAVMRGNGRIVENLRDMPPAGKWKEYPCCVVVASNEMIAKNPEAVRDFVAFINAAGDWANANREKAGTVAASWIGLPPELGQHTSLRFVRSFSPSWLEGAAGYLEVLGGSGYFTGSLKDKNLDQAKDTLLDTRFVSR